MPKLREDISHRAEQIFLDNDSVDAPTALKAVLETLVHEGYLSVMPPSKQCTECRGSKMTEGTIGFFSCLKCGGRGRVPV